MTADDALPDADEVAWYPNSYRESRVRVDRRLVQLAVLAGPLALAGLAIVLLRLVRSGLPSWLLGVGWVLLLGAGIACLFAVQQFTPRFSASRSWYSPTRVGFSSQGIHVTFEDALARRRAGRRQYSLDPSRTFIAWDSIEGISASNHLYGPHTVAFSTAQGPEPAIVSVSTELADRITSEVEKHAMDLGPD